MSRDPRMSYTASRYDFQDKPADYGRLAQELAALLASPATSPAMRRRARRSWCR
jgi:hypothetical protein